MLIELRVMAELPPDLDAILAAAVRLEGRVHRTPVLSARSLGERKELAGITRGSWPEATETALAACNTSAAGPCRIEYARCND